MPLADWIFPPILRNVHKLSFQIMHSQSFCTRFIPLNPWPPSDDGEIPSAPGFLEQWEYSTPGPRYLSLVSLAPLFVLHLLIPNLFWVFLLLLFRGA